MTTLHLFTKQASQATKRAPQSMRLRSWKDYQLQATVDWLLLDLRLTCAAPLEQVAACFGDQFLAIGSLSGTHAPAKSVVVKAKLGQGTEAIGAALLAIQDRWGQSREPQVEACQVALDVKTAAHVALPEQALRDELAMLGAHWVWFSNSIVSGPRRVGSGKRTTHRLVRCQSQLVQALKRGDQVFLGEDAAVLTQQVVLLPQPAFAGSEARSPSGMRMQLQVNGELGWLQLGLRTSPFWYEFVRAVAQPTIYRNFQRHTCLGGDSFNRRVSHAFRALERGLSGE